MNNLDQIIQKYLHNQTTPEEEKWLLEQLLKFYNWMLQLNRRIKCHKEDQ